VANTKKGKTKRAKTTGSRSASKKPAAKKKTTAKPAQSDAPVAVERRTRADRRTTPDRRKKTKPVAVERRKIERRAKVNRRRQIDPTTCERDYSCEEIEFMNALDEYKRTSGRMFPTCSEILEVIKKLGYRKCSAGELAGALGAEPANQPGNGSDKLQEQQEVIV